MKKWIGLLCLLACACAGALDLSGAAPQQVFQCNDAGEADIALAGKAGTAGAIEARVLDRFALEAVGWTQLDDAEPDALWEGTLPGVPVGGPYTLEVRVVSTDGPVAELETVPGILVGDLWILAGQSNMQGVGNKQDVAPPHPLVHVYAMNHDWRLAAEPLHVLQESPDPVHFKLDDESKRAAAIAKAYEWVKGAGLGLPFAREMVTRTGRPIGLIASAHGGTSMDQWDPAKRDEGGESLYGSMYKQVMKAGGTVRGVVWYQGESDANEKAAPAFRKKFKHLVAAMRKDFKRPDLPFYYVQIGRFVTPGDGAEWTFIQTEQLAAEAEIDRAGMVASIDLALDDPIHVGTRGLKTLGWRLANLAEADLFGGAILPGPRFEEITREKTEYGMTWRVRFSGVNGALSAAGRPSGFSISAGADGKPFPAVYKVALDPAAPDTAVLWTGKLPENPHLWYGRGLNPYCNMTDSANMAVPVFGPVPLPEE